MKNGTKFLLMYVGVSLLIAFIGGFVVGPSPEEKKGDWDLQWMLVWVWPLGALFAVVLSPGWLPVVVRYAAVYIKNKRDKARAITELMNRVKPDR